MLALLTLCLTIIITNNKVTIKQGDSDCEVIFFDFSLTVKAAPHKCVIRTGQPKA